MEKNQSHSAFIKVLIAIAVAVALLLVYLLAFTVEQRKGIYHNHTQSLYNTAVLYSLQNVNLHDQLYDTTDEQYNYITDISKFAGDFPYGGSIEIAFTKAGDVVYAKWYHPADDFVDSILPAYFVYPSHMDT